MKLILLISILLISREIKSQIDSVKSIYILSQKSNTSTYVLHLRSNDSYEVIDFLNSKEATFPVSMVDTGSYSIIKKIGIKTISFKSEKKKKFSINGNTYIIYKDKLYEKFFDPFLKKPFNAILTKDTVYNQSIPFDEIKKNSKIKEDYTKKFFMNQINKYSISYADIIEESYCGPGCYFSLVGGKTIDWNKDTNYQVLLGQYETMVHETTHHYNGGSKGYNWDTKLWSERVLVEPGITISYSQTTTFKSELFISIVPKEAPKKIFRYKTYVNKGSDVSANLSGIYGLMDEFSAYRNGCRSAIEACNTAIKNKDNKMIEFFEEKFLGTYFAYYEFRLFIAWYLEYAEKNKLDIYKKTLANNNLRVAFTLLDKGFLEDIKQLEEIIKKYPHYSYDYFEKENAQYCKTLLVDHEKTLQKFKIEGVDTKNYKDFLKKEEPIKKK